MATAASIQTYQKVAFAATGSSTFTCFPRVGYDVSKKGNTYVPETTTGLSARPKETTREGPYAVNGPLAFVLTPAIFTYFIGYISGDVSSPYTNQEPSGGLLPTFQGAVDRVAQMHNATGCVVSKCSMSFQRGMPITMGLDIEALDELLGASSNLSQGAIAALSPSLSPPYIFSDCVLTVGGTSYPFAGGSVTIDNVLETNRWFGGSLTRDSLPKLDLRVHVTINMPYNSTSKALYNTGITDAAVVFTATNGSNVLVLTFPAVIFPATPPTDPPRGETELILAGEAFSSASGAVYSFTES